MTYAVKRPPYPDRLAAARADLAEMRRSGVSLVTATLLASKRHNVRPNDLTENPDVRL